tara:strand:+ start:1019 stop:1627 length:609 start_codon:yes stop_codon:yes gene_type:complete
MNRKKKLRLVQFFLFLTGLVLIFFTYYYNSSKNFKTEIVDEKNLAKVKKQLSSDNQEAENLFYNVEYSGLDLSGNRYLLKSKEAYSPADNQAIVYMSFVTAFFYFKDNTVLTVESKKGEYNNETLDMRFSEKVVANYENSKMYASNAEYSNSKGFLTISDNVKIEDLKGTMVADKLNFDINKKKLEIESFNNNNINANINLK